MLWMMVKEKPANHRQDRVENAKDDGLYSKSFLSIFKVNEYIVLHNQLDVKWREPNGWNCTQDFFFEPVMQNDDAS